DAGTGGHASCWRDGHARCSLSFTVPSGVAARGRLPEWPKGAVCKTVGLAYPGSNPGPATASGDALELARLSSRLILSRAAECGSGCSCAGRCAQYVPKFARCRSSSSGRSWHVLVLVGHGGFLDPALGLVLLPRDALCVDAQQDGDAVSCPLGDLRGGYSSVQPGGNGRVPQVVGRLASRDAPSWPVKATARALWKTLR